MKVLTAAVCFTILLLSLTLLAEDQPADFSGKWIPDLKKSDLTAKNIQAPGNSGVSDPSRGGGFGGGMMGGGGFGGPPPKAKAPTTLPSIVITQTPTNMQISTPMVVNGVEGAPYIENYALDRKEDLVEKVPNMWTKQEEKKRTKISLKKNKFQVRAITEGQYGNTETKKTFELSKDGKTMTMEMLQDMGFSQTLQKIVYTRE